MPHSIPRQNKENTKEGEEGIKIVKYNIFQRSHFKIEVTLIDKMMTESLLNGLFMLEKRTITSPMRKFELIQVKGTKNNINRSNKKEHLNWKYKERV